MWRVERNTTRRGRAVEPVTFLRTRRWRRVRDVRRKAAVVGRLIAERAKAAGIDKVVFDRAGYRYHGRVAALADAAREAGLEF